MLEVKNLKAKVEDTRILRGIDLKVDDGKTVVIMGPNGSGKSTLSSCIAGDPRYEITDGEMLLDGENINKMGADERAKKGIFLAHQSPLAIEGLISETFLWQLEQLHHPGVRKLDEFQNWLRKTAADLELDIELLERGLNDDFSGGERKKMEIIQLLIVKPKLIILDEIDSGLDIDALKHVTKAVSQYQKESGASAIVITHYTRILEHLNADSVHVMKRGKVTRSGDKTLVADIEANGY
jgi:Fe-S cluster assembly ATP-binding protein